MIYKKLEQPVIPPSMTVKFTFWFDGGTLVTINVRANSLERAWLEFRNWWPEDRAIVVKTDITKDKFNEDPNGIVDNNIVDPTIGGISVRMAS